MTITCCDYYFTSDYERCSSLAFGVPLEDCFPAGDIHPSLKELFLNAYENIALCGYPVDEIISKLQGSIGERLSIKESVVLCKPMSGVLPPGALLWVIRHFVGLIPVPLLSRYADSKTFNWIGLSQFCKRALLRAPEIGGGDKLLVRKIVQELLRLPFPNLLLFSVLVNFIRSLTTVERRTPNVNKLAAICLIKYFCSSIFVRPYRPDNDGKVERVYVPFLLFVVLRWPQIERVFKEKAAASQDSHKRNCLGTTNSPDFNPCFEHQIYRARPASTDSKIACTQTDDYQSELSTISEESLEGDFLRDVGCQTEFSPLRKMRPHYRCCCRYGSNYEMNENQGLNVSFQEKEAQTESCEFGEEDSLVGTVLSLLPRSSGKANSNNDSEEQDIQNLEVGSPPATFITDGEYNNLVSTKNKCDPEILARVSKIGWSYTPRSDDISGLSPKDEDSLLYFNEEESEKDSLSAEGELLGKSTSGSSTKSKRSFTLGKIRSGLDLFKLFSRRKAKLTNASSLDEVSKVKYEKMNSVKSTVF